MDANNDLIAFYVYDGAGLVAKVTSASEYYFYHYDGLGSTVAITDSTAQIVNAYAYSPYGLVGAQETIPNAFTYVGRYGVMAEGNGLYFMRARYYDPEVGRFINKDPIGYMGGMNLYGYVGNNPINFIDPHGLGPRFDTGYDESCTGDDSEKYRRWLITAGIINESTNVTLMSINALKLGTSTTHLLGSMTSYVGIGLSGYGVYEGVSNKDYLLATMSASDLSVGIVTLTVASAGCPECAAVITIVYAGSKWAILSSSSTPKVSEHYFSGGGGAARNW